MLDEELESLIGNTEEELSDLQEKFNAVRQNMDQIQEFKQDIEKKVDIQASNIDFDKLSRFVSNGQYYLINEVGDQEYEVVIPQFLDVQVGLLDRQIRGFNVFILDQTTKMISGIPDFLTDEVELDDDQLFKVKGDLLEFDEDQKEVVEEELSEHVTDIEDEKATIKEDHGYSLVRDLLDRGEIPFTPKPIDESDLRETETNIEFEDYPHQQRAYDKWRENGSITLCFMTGGGKSFPSMEALDSVKYDEDSMRKAIVVASKSNQEQWEQYIEEFAPRLSEEVEIYTYHSLHKMEQKIKDGKEYGIVVFDEAHKLPANTFARSSTFPIKYRLGLTASPYREDGRQNDIFALCGEPLGMQWNEQMEIMGKDYHPINIHIVDDRDQKIQGVVDALEKIGDKRTLIFVDKIDFGKELSEETGLEFVYGESSDQLQKIQENQQVIVSRIADHGVSIDDLEVILEADFLGGSRRQQIQRTGRLMHGEGERHDIFFTPGEFNKFQKRLYGLIEKGFSLNFVNGEERELEIPDKYEGRIQMDLEQGESVSEETHESSVSSNPIQFLKNDKIQDVINEKIENYNELGSESIWEGLIAIARSENGLDHNDIEDLEITSAGYKVTKPFRESDPQILVEKNGNYVLNTEEWKKIIEKEKQKKKERQEIQDLKEEVLG